MTKTQTVSPKPLLLNRELSWLDYDARVLELADDESVPLLERVKFCSIFSDMLDEFFMVRVAGLMDQADVGRLGALGRRAHAARGARRDPRARRGDDGEPVAALDARSSAPRSPPRESSSPTWTTAPRTSSTSSRRASRRDLPGPDAARGRPRPAVPVHLGALAEPRGVRARPGVRRGAVRARQGPGGAAALPRARPAEAPAPARGRDRALPRRALPGDGDPRAGGLPRHPRRRPRGLRRRRRPPRGGRAELRRRRFGDVVRLEVSSTMSKTMLERLPDGLGVGERDLPVQGHARPRRADADRGARPARAEGRPLAPDDAGPSRSRRATATVRGDPPQRHPRPPSLRLVRDELRGVHPHRGVRPRRDRAEDDRVPHERRLADRAGADRPRPSTASRASAWSSSRRAATSTATSSGRAGSSRRASTSCTASPT